MPSSQRAAARAVAALVLAACARAVPPAAPTPSPTPAPAGAPVPAAPGAAPAEAPAAPAPAVPVAHAVIPAPTSADIAPADSFRLDTTTTVVIDAAAPAEVEAVARAAAAFVPLAAALPGAPRPMPAVPRRLAAGEAPPARSIYLTLDPRLADGPVGVRKDASGAAAPAPVGDEGYALEVTRDRVTIAARRPAGLYYGVQTLRQLLPSGVEHAGALGRRLAAPAGRVSDAPRFAWRGLMLDVSRHFLPPADVKRFIDAMALYKMNRLHLHLSDDQGWRLEIKSRPELTRVGGSTQVGGGAGGFYTQAEYADLVAYAAARYVMVVPEFDMPAHTNAALASIPALNCDGRAVPLYTGTKVGFSALCPDKPETYRFIDDVVREVAALTPGPYVHIGGDEVEKLTHAQYVAFVERVQGIVRARGKRMIGWSETATAQLHPSSVVQSWIPDSSAKHAARGGSVILSPAKRIYLDMKYDSATTLGLRWAGLVSVRTAYDWEPATYAAGIAERSILGVEAPIWSETVVTRGDFEFLVFPRLAAAAELGWSSPSVRGWEGFRARLAQHGPRLSALGVNFYRSPEIPWATGAAPAAPALVP